MFTIFMPHQINKDGALRLSGGTRHNLTSEAGKAMDNIRTLVSNKAYSAHIPTLQVFMTLGLCQCELDFRVRFVRRVYSAYIGEYFWISLTEFYQKFRITSNA